MRPAADLELTDRVDRFEEFGRDVSQPTAVGDESLARILKRIAVVAERHR
jgi:hypothetical protein